MLKSLLQKLISSIRPESMEKLFFALFLLSIPLQTRLTFITPQTYLNGQFNEYATFFIYLSDIFLIITLLLYFVNFTKNSKNLTKYNNFSIKYHLIHTYPHFIPIFILLITLVTWSFVTIFWSTYKNTSFYQAIKLLEISLLFFYIAKRAQWFNLNKIFTIIFISGFFESLIGITQYYLQKSLGLKILMESVLSPEIPNVAKIIIDNEKIIRAYGTYPHPNVFSGFLILSIFCGICLFLDHKISKTFKIVSRETILNVFLIIGIIIQLTALILTFSRTAWLSTVVIFSIFIFFIIKSKLFRAIPLNPPQNKEWFIQNKIIKLFHVKQFDAEYRQMMQFNGFIFRKRIIFLLLSIIPPLLIVVSFNWKQINNRASLNQNILYQQSTENRILYNNIAFNIIKRYPLTGIGGKNYTVKMQKFTEKRLELWQFQPAHNVYLLIASELGITGLFLFTSLLYLVVKNLLLNIKTEIVSRETIFGKAMNGKTIYTKTGTVKTSLTVTGSTIAQNNGAILLKLGLISILAGFLFIGLFDHYFWTLQQGQLSFWIILGLIVSLNTNHK